MSFLNKITEKFAKKKEPVSENVALENLINYLKERNRADLIEMRNEILKFKTETLRSFDRIKEINDDLNNIKAFDILSRASVEVKNDFCEKVSNILDSVPGKEADYKEFIERSERVMHEINKITPRQAAHMAYFFKDHLVKMASVMKSIQDGINELKEHLSTSIISDMENVQNGIESITENSRKMEYIDKNVEEIDGEILELEKKRKSQKERIPDADNKKVSELDTEIKEMDDERKRMEQDIDTRFGGITKLLKKFSYETKNPFLKSIADKYISSPSYAFFNVDGNFDIKRILVEIKLEYDTGKYGSDDNHYDSLKDILDNFVQVRKMVDRYYILEKKLTASKDEMASERNRLEKIGRLSEEAGEVGRKIAELQSMKEQLVGTRKKLGDEISAKIKDMEFVISGDMESNIKIVYTPENEKKHHGE